MIGLGRKRLAAAALGSLLVAWSAGAKAETQITFAGFGGFVLDNEVEHLFGKAKTLGITVIKARNSGWAGVKAHLTSNAPGWDIISIGAARCEMASQAGFLVPIDYTIVDKKLIPPHLAQPNYVGVYTFAYGIVYQKAKYGANPPKSWADFWDVKKFPGRRSLESEGLYSLEAALMADGVPMQDVYKVLKTPAGLERAFNKIKEIKPHVSVWWNATGQVMQLVRDGEVDMALISNGRVAALTEAGTNLGYVWNGGMIDIDCFMVPKTSANPKEAMRLMNLAFDPIAQARFGQNTKYGPVNPKAFDAGIMKPAELAWIPTAPQNLDKQIYVDPKWYASPEAEAAYKRFTEIIR